MKKLLIFWFLIGLCTTVSGQSEVSEYEIINHDVKPGETIRLLSLKYLVTPSDIYKLNKFAINGIEQGMVLLIPVRRKAAKKADAESLPPTDIAERPAKQPEGPSEATATDIPTTHTVQPKETLSSLARKYGTTVVAISTLNEKLLQRGLQPGQVLKLPARTETDQPTAEPTSNNQPAAGTNIIEHTVAGKETLYSISKKYNIPVDVIVSQNEKLLAQGLQAGQVIKIKPNK